MGINVSFSETGLSRPALVDPSGTELTSATASITKTEPDNIVPGAGVWFDVDIGSGFSVTQVTSPVTADDPTEHRLMYYWDFDDPGEFTAPLQCPTEWKNRNVAKGKHAYYAWSTTGTKTVTCLIIDMDDSDNWKRITTTVTVVSTQTAYPGSRTILVDPDDIGDNTTYPSSQVVTTVSAGITALAALGNTGCVLLKRGETYTESSEISLTDSLDNIHIGAYGSGAKPILKRARNNSGSLNFFNFANSVDIFETVLENLRFEGPWNPEKEIGDPRFNPLRCNGQFANPWTIHTFRCEFDGCGAFRPWSGIEDTLRSAVFDCSITNWQDYGIHLAPSGSPLYDQDKWAAIIGTAIHQPNACHGQGGKGGFIMVADHGPLRYVDAMKCIIGACSAASSNTWTGNGVQPCYRIAQGGNGTPTGGYRLNAWNVTALTGYFGIDGQNDSAPSYPGNHVVDGLLVLNSWGSDAFFGCGYGGTTFRNGLLIRRDSDKNVSGGAIIDLTADNPQTGNNTARMDISHVLMVNLATDTDFTKIVAESTFTNRDIEIDYHQPSITSPETTNAPIDISTTLSEITMYSAGRRLGHNKSSFAITTTTSGNTLTMSWPSGLTLADVVEGGLHGIVLNDSDYYYNDEDDITFRFYADRIEADNETGDTWSGNARLALECEEAFYPDDDFDLATTTVPVCRQQSGSALINGASGVKAYDDLFMKPRDGTPDAGPWEGTSE